MREPIVNGVRLGLGVAIIGTLLAETKLSNRGLGYLVIQAYALFDMPRMYALLILLFVLVDRRQRSHRAAVARAQGAFSVEIRGTSRPPSIAAPCRFRSCSLAAAGFGM